MKNICYFFILIFSLVGISVKAQNVISGKVANSEDNSPIVGAGVQVDGTTYGARTNSTGEFKINLPENMTGEQKLKVSYLGYKTRYVTVTSDQSNIEINLDEDKQKIDEVVVTAIGIKKEKKSLGYASQSVTSNEITQAAQGDVFKGMDGKVAGLQVTQTSGVAGAGVNMRLRAPTSLLGSNQPLLVVDGIIIDNSTNWGGNPSDVNNTSLGSNGSTSSSNRGVDLNPEDIESVNVLKGASASALYGTLASNGAIIITTKKGKSKNDTKKGISFTYNTSYSFDNVNRFIKLQETYAQGDTGIYLDPSISVYNGGGSWGARIDTLRYLQDPNYTYTRAGRIVGMSTPGAGAAVSPFNSQKNFFDQGYTFDNSIALAGGSDKSSFRFSMSDRNQKGYMPNNYYNRFTMALGASNEFTEKFNMNFSLNYTNSNENQLQQGSNTSGIMLGLLRTPITFDNANGSENPNDVNNRAYQFINGRQRTFRGGGGYNNPYWSANNDYSKTLLDRIMGNVTANLILNSFMTLTGRVGADVYSQRNHQFIEINSRTSPAGSNRTNNVNSTIITSDLFLTMPFTLSKNWNSNFVIGSNLYDNSSSQYYTEGNGLVQFGYANMANASSYNSSEVYGNLRRFSLYTVAKFDYKNKWYMEGTLRMDKTSTLSPGNNTYVYPSVNLSYIFSEDIKPNKVLTFGKVRGSFALVGKDAPQYSTLNYFGATYFEDAWSGNGIKFPFNGTQSFTSVNTAGNNNLKAEFVYNYELGTEMKFFENRLGFDFSFYYNISTNQILPVPISSATGYAAIVLNAGKLSNHGFEVNLYGTPVKTKDFKWDVFINWSLYRSKVLEIYPGVNTISVGGYSGTTVNHIVGQPWGQIYTSEFLRDASGNMIINDNPIDKKGYGKPIADPNPRIMGNPNPNFIMAIGNTFTYKNLSLSALFSWKNGGEMWNGTRGTLNYFGLTVETENRESTTVFNGVLGHVNDYGQVLHYDASGNEIAGTGGVNSIVTPTNQTWYQGNGGGFASAVGQFVEKADFFKLRELTLSYQFKTENWKFVKGLELGGFVRNILIWTPYTGVDPEQSLAGASNIIGLDYYTMPGMRSIGLKARLSF